MPIATSSNYDHRLNIKRDLLMGVKAKVIHHNPLKSDRVIAFLVL